MGNTTGPANGSNELAMTKSEKVQQEMSKMIEQHKLHLKMFRKQQEDHTSNAKVAMRLKKTGIAKQEFLHYRQLESQILSVQNAINAMQRQQNTLYQQDVNDKIMRLMKTAARVNAGSNTLELEHAIATADHAAEIADMTADMAAALSDNNSGAINTLDGDDEWQNFCSMLNTDAAEPPPPANTAPPSFTEALASNVPNVLPEIQTAPVVPSVHAVSQNNAATFTLMPSSSN